MGLVEYVIVGLVGAGVVFTIMATVGVLRFPDLYTCLLPINP